MAGAAGGDRPRSRARRDGPVTPRRHVRRRGRGRRDPGAAAPVARPAARRARPRRSRAGLATSQLRYGITDVPERQARRSAVFEPDTAGHLGVFGASGTGQVGAAAHARRRRGERRRARARLRARLRRRRAADALAPAERRCRSSRATTSSAAPGCSARCAPCSTSGPCRSPQVNASTITEYRALTGRARAADPAARRQLPGVPGRVRHERERSAVYTTLLRILSEGRQFGVHLVLTADRAGAMPTAVLAGVQERVVLRLADDSTYLVLGAPNDVLTAASPPGRALVDGHETQIAVPGGSANVVEQSSALELLAADLRRAADPVVAPPVRSLPTEIDPEDLPDRVGDRPVLGRLGRRPAAGRVRPVRRVRDRRRSRQRPDDRADLDRAGAPPLRPRRRAALPRPPAVAGARARCLDAGRRRRRRRSGRSPRRSRPVSPPARPVRAARRASWRSSRGSPTSCPARPTRRSSS